MCFINIHMSEENPSVTVTICNAGRCKGLQTIKKFPIVSQIAKDNMVSPDQLKNAGITGMIRGQRARLCISTTCLGKCTENAKQSGCTRISNGSQEEWVFPESGKNPSLEQYLEDVEDWIESLTQRP